MQTITETTQEQVAETLLASTEQKHLIKNSSGGFNLFAIGTSLAKLLPSWGSSSQTPASMLNGKAHPLPFSGSMCSATQASPSSCGVNTLASTEDTCSICFNVLLPSSSPQPSLSEEHPYIVTNPDLSTVPFVPDRLSLLPCVHTFCPRCILVWARKKRDCPLCKRGFRGFLFGATGGLEFRVEIGLGGGEPASRIGSTGIGINPLGGIGAAAEAGVRTRRAFNRGGEDARIQGGGRSREREPSPSDSRDICYVCLAGTNPSLLLVCDGCDYRTAHTFCLGLGNTIPRGRWYCRWCEMDGTAQVKREEQAAKKLERARALQLLQQELENQTNGLSSQNPIKRPKKPRRKPLLNLSRRKKDHRRRAGPPSNLLTSAELENEPDCDNGQETGEKDEENEEPQVNFEEKLEVQQTDANLQEAVEKSMNSSQRQKSIRTPTKFHQLRKVGHQQDHEDGVPDVPKPLTIRQFRAENRTRKLAHLPPLETPEYLKPMKSRKQIPSDLPTSDPSDNNFTLTPSPDTEEPLESNKILQSYMEFQQSMPDRQSPELAKINGTISLLEFEGQRLGLSPESEHTESIESREQKRRKKGKDTVVHQSRDVVVGLTDILGRVWKAESQCQPSQIVDEQAAADKQPHEKAKESAEVADHQGSPAGEDPPRAPSPGSSAPSVQVPPRPKKLFREEHESPPRARELFCSPEQSRNKLFKRIKTVQLQEVRARRETGAAEVGMDEGQAEVEVEEAEEVGGGETLDSGRLRTESVGRITGLRSCSQTYLEDEGEATNPEEEAVMLGKRSVRSCTRGRRGTKQMGGKLSVRSCPGTRWGLVRLQKSGMETGRFQLGKQRSSGCTGEKPQCQTDQDNSTRVGQMSPDTQIARCREEQGALPHTDPSLGNFLQQQQQRVLIAREEFFETDEDLSRYSLSVGETVALDQDDTAETVFFTCLEIESAELEALKRELGVK